MLRKCHLLAFLWPFVVNVCLRVSLPGRKPIGVESQRCLVVNALGNNPQPAMDGKRVDQHPSSLAPGLCVGGFQACCTLSPGVLGGRKPHCSLRWPCLGSIPLCGCLPFTVSCPPPLPVLPAVPNKLPVCQSLCQVLLLQEPEPSLRFHASAPCDGWHDVS